MTAKWNATYKKKHPDRVRESHKKYDSTKRDRIKARVRARTNHIYKKRGFCFECFFKGKTEVHHLSYEPNIFTELCRCCHMKKHEEDLK